MARTVLLADDSVTAQNMGRRILIDAGYEVITVNNGSAALKKIHESRPDLIVLDVYMPGYGGLEVCQRLKESSETTKIPVLLTVGKMEPFKSEEARRVRADGHIVKPFEASELLAALTKLEDRIVPQAEPSRGRKGKSEKRARSWQVADPAVSFDDTHSDKIAYLEQVKQRHTKGEAEESRGEIAETVTGGSLAAEGGPASSASSSASATASSVPDSEGPQMPRPMSVYAADALREHPVAEEPEPAPVRVRAAAPPPPPQEFAVQEGDGFTQSDSVEGDSLGFAPPSVTNEEAPSEVPVENPPSSVVESAPAEESSLASASSEAEAVSADHDSVTEASVQATETEAQPESAAAPSRWVAENVALTAEEASLELEREMNQINAVSAAPAESTIDVQSDTPVPAESPAPVSEETNGATFAAAAGASSASAVAVTPTESEPEPPVGPETAAAWQNWQHIRDSVMGSQTAISLSESVAEVVQKSVSESVAEVAAMDVSTAAQPTAQPSADTDSESAELSSIVDSVLADLKPRLMAEISKKLKK